MARRLESLPEKEGGSRWSCCKVIVGEYEKGTCQPVCAMTTGRHHGLESLTVYVIGEGVR